MNVIEFNSITKEYVNGKKRFLAIDNISFTVSKGEVIGLVGPNGAGKSTIVKMLCGILAPTSGSIRVLGIEPSKNRKKLSHEIGVMFGNRSSLWYNLPAKESVLLIQCIYGIDDRVFQERLQKYGKILNVLDILEKPVRQMSLGQRIRVELLVTVLHNPKLLILDEPTLGLDIVAKLKFREMLSDLAGNSNTTIVLTTHDLGDVEKLCNKVILINNGCKLVDMCSEEFSRISEKYEVILIENNSKYDLSCEDHLRETTEQWYKFFIQKDQKKKFIEEILEKCNYELQIKTEKSNLEDILYEYYS